MAGSGDAHLCSSDAEPVLSVADLVVEFPVGRRTVVHALSGVSIDLLDGETLGVVGESGCGKTTLGRTIMQLERAVSGAVEYAGATLTDLSGQALAKARSGMQMIFQDPVSSLNPRRRVRDIVREGLEIWGDAELATYMFELGPQDCGTVGVLQNVIIGPCLDGVMVITGPPGSEVWFWVGPTTFSSPDGSDVYEYDYVLMNYTIWDAVEQHTLSEVKALFD